MPKDFKDGRSPPKPTNDFTEDQLKRLRGIMEKEKRLKLDDDQLLDAAYAILRRVAANEMSQMRHFIENRAKQTTQP